MAQRKKSPASGHPILQRIMALLGVLITTAAVAVIVHAAIQPSSPPDLIAEVVAARPAAQGFIAEVRVRNIGRDTAVGAQVEGRSGAETASAAVAYVPGLGQVTIELAFPGDPAPVQARVTGWSKP